MVEHALCLCAHVLAIFNICTCMYVLYILLEVNIVMAFLVNMMRQYNGNVLE